VDQSLALPKTLISVVADDNSAIETQHSGRVGRSAAGDRPDDRQYRAQLSKRPTRGFLDDCFRRYPRHLTDGAVDVGEETGRVTFEYVRHSIDCSVH
jgi:hypothetical protein